MQESKNPTPRTIEEKIRAVLQSQSILIKTFQRNIYNILSPLKDYNLSENPTFLTDFISQCQIKFSQSTITLQNELKDYIQKEATKHLENDPLNLEYFLNEMTSSFKSLDILASINLEKTTINGERVVKHFGDLFGVFGRFKLLLSKASPSKDLDLRFLLPPRNAKKVDHMIKPHPKVTQIELLKGSYTSKIRNIMKDALKYSSPVIGPFLYEDSEVHKILGGTYHGQYFNGLRHGLGRFVSVSGSVYEGQLVEDKGCGPGRFIGIDGTVYEGDFLYNQPHGKGKQIFSDGGVYEGEWKHGITHGVGEYVFPSGNVFKGEWKDGKRHGQGVFIRDGETMVGVWDNGELAKWL